MNRNAIDVSAIARQNAEAIKHALGTKKKAGIAAGMGVSPSVVTEIKEAEIEKYSTMVANCDLKLVPADAMYFPPHLYAAMLTMTHHMAGELVDKTSQDN